MLIAALRSRSWTAPQSLHCQFLSRKSNASLIAPQAEQVLLVGYHLSTKLILIPFLAAMYFNFATKSAKPRSLTLRPHSVFMPCRFKSSRRISSYASVSSCANFQWKSSRPFVILRCFRAKSSLALSRFFESFCFRECARLARLIAFILRLKNSGEFISCRESAALISLQSMQPIPL